MTTMGDLVANMATVNIRGNDLPVFPLTLSHFGLLVARHPNLIGAIRGQEGIVDAVMGEGASAINFAIACATFQGDPDDDAGLLEEVKRVKAARLTAAEQGNILLTSIENTLPESDEDLVDFMKRLGVVMGRAATAAGK